MPRKKALLVLGDGSYFEGEAIGADGIASGEVVFSTCMTGYQEMLTDPSFRGQILTLTYPLVGNYGTTEGDMESAVAQVAGFVVKELCEEGSNWRKEAETQEFLRKRGVVGIAGVDTRALTRRLRSHGVLMGTITTAESVEEALARLGGEQDYASIDFVQEVTTRSPYQWGQVHRPGAAQSRMIFSDEPRIAVIDYGTKRNILRSLEALGCEVIVFPCWFSAEDILGFDPDGIVLSPGPGNPALLGQAIETVKGLLGKRPIMGICLGQQIIAYAAGGKTYKLKFGHRGGNHPVKDLASGRVHITSQNHGFAVDPDSLGGSGLEVSQVNLNDGTPEGLVHTSLPVWCVQYHPEASPGPMDNRGAFAEFVNHVKG